MTGKWKVIIWFNNNGFVNVFHSVSYSLHIKFFMLFSVYFIFDMPWVTVIKINWPLDIHKNSSLWSGCHSSVGSLDLWSQGSEKSLSGLITMVLWMSFTVYLILCILKFLCYLVCILSLTWTVCCLELNKPWEFIEDYTAGILGFVVFYFFVLSHLVTPSIVNVENMLL